MEQGEHLTHNQGDDHADGHHGQQDGDLGARSTENTQASPGGPDGDTADRARGGAPDSTADGGAGAVHRARATGVRGPPPRPSLES